MVLLVRFHISVKYFCLTHMVISTVCLVLQEPVPCQYIDLHPYRTVDSFGFWFTVRVAVVFIPCNSHRYTAVCHIRYGAQ